MHFTKHPKHKLWGNRAGYTIAHTKAGLVSYRVTGPRGERVGGANSLSQAKQLAEEHCSRV